MPLPLANFHQIWSLPITRELAFKPITITANDGKLDFGVIVSTGSGGNVKESGGHDSYSNPSMDPGNDNRGTVQDAVFDVTGEDNAYFEYSSGSFTPALPGGFSLSLSGADNSNAQMGPGGTYTITVGGTLTVPGGASAQSISQGWTETVQYN